MRSLTVVAVFLAWAGSLAADTREAAWQARARLGPDRWSEVLRITRGPARSARSQVFYALVFELEGRLWFYAGDRGTESLSTHRGRLAQDKADPGPLLREIDPSIAGFEVMGEDTAPAAGRSRSTPLPEGCFIECVAYLQALLDAGRTIEDARLLAYYGQPGGPVRGHTLLYFQENGRRFCFDPGGRPALRSVSDKVAPDALAIARATAPGVAYAPPARAVFFPLQRTLLPAEDDRMRRNIAAGGAAVRRPLAPALLN